MDIWGLGTFTIATLTLFGGLLAGYVMGARDRKQAPKEPPRVVESDPRTWDELQVSIEGAQRESAP